MNRIPNPGSAEALRQHCTCPVIDNCHGRGYRGGPAFVTDEWCQVHGKDSTWERDNKK